MTSSLTGQIRQLVHKIPTTPTKGHLKNGSGFELCGRRWRLDELGTRGLGLFRLDKALDFGAKTHPAIAKRVGFGMHDARFAMSLFWLASCDFDGHPESGLNRHAHLEWRRGHEKKTAARKIYGFGEVFGVVGSKSNRAEAQRYPKTKPFKMSTFRSHAYSERWIVCGSRSPHLSEPRVTDGKAWSKTRS